MPEPTPDPNGVTLLPQLAYQAIRDSERWFPKTAGDLVHYALALNGEAGELANLVKKIHRGSVSERDIVVQEDIDEELIDVFTYILCIAGLRRLDLLNGYLRKRRKNTERWG